MANRNTLHVDRLEDFKRWLSGDGWDLENPKGDYEVLRARKSDRKRPLILWRRLGNNGGGDLTHLTYDDRDGGVVRAFLADRKKSSEEFSITDLLLLVQRTGADVAIKPCDPPGGPNNMHFSVRLTKLVRPTHGDMIPWAMEADVYPRAGMGLPDVMKLTLEMLEHELDLATRDRYHEEAERRRRSNE